MNLFERRSTGGQPEDPASKKRLESTLGAARYADYEALIDVLRFRTDPISTCSALGHQFAQSHVGLEQALEGMWQVYLAVTGGPPPPQPVAALAMSWAQSYYQPGGKIADLDSASGVATERYLRLRIRELATHVRPGASGLAEWALVIIDFSRAQQPLESEKTARIITPVRHTLPADTLVTQLTAGRLAALIPSSVNTAITTSELRQALSDVCPLILVWEEELPTQLSAAERLLDELAHS